MKILLTIFYLIVIPAYAQPTQKFSPNELEEDFEIFRGSLEDFHPGLYWYRSKEEVDHVFDRVKAALTIPMTDKEFIRILAPVISFIGCGHTWVIPQKSRPSIFLPIEMVIHEQSAFCRSNLSEGSLSVQPEDEILAVNGIEMDSLISLLMKFVPGDGFITTGKSFIINNYLPNVYPHYFETSDEYVLTIKRQGQEKEVVVGSLPVKEIENNAKNRNQEITDPRNLTLEYHKEISTAVLTVKHFFDWQEEGKTIRFESRLQKLFESIDSSKVDHLIIDVRDNGGGKVPWVLLSYFIKEEFVLAKQADFIFSRKSPYYPYQELHPAMRFLKRKWLHTWVPGSNKMKKQNNSRFALTGLFMTRLYKPTRPQFDGAVYILTNGGSFSATSDFVAMMKSNGLATTVGEETGGGYYGNTSMERSFVTLPNSKLRLEIPLVRHQLNVKPTFKLGRGTLPDHYVPKTLEDKLHGADAQLEYTLELIKNRNTSVD